MNQDLKQQKFVIEAEPSETVGFNPTSLQSGIDTDASILMHLSLDWRGEREDIQGERMGGWPTETHIFRYDFTLWLEH